MTFETYRKRGKGWEYLGTRRSANSRSAAQQAGYVHNLKVIGVRTEYSRDKILVYRFQYVPQLHHGA